MRRALLLFAALAAFAAAGAQPALSSAAGPRPCMIFLFGGGF